MLSTVSSVSSLSVVSSGTQACIVETLILNAETLFPGGKLTLGHSSI